MGMCMCKRNLGNSGLFLNTFCLNVLRTQPASLASISSQLSFPGHNLYLNPLTHLPLCSKGLCLWTLESETKMFLDRGKDLGKKDEEEAGETLGSCCRPRVIHVGPHKSPMCRGRYTFEDPAYLLGPDLEESPLNVSFPLRIVVGALSLKWWREGRREGGKVRGGERGLLGSGGSNLCSALDVWGTWCQEHKVEITTIYLCIIFSI